VSGGGVAVAQRVAEPEFAPIFGDEFDFGAGEVGFRGDEEEIRDCGGADYVRGRAFLR
jgi:hypothetical protein